MISNTTFNPKGEREKERDRFWGPQFEGDTAGESVRTGAGLTTTIGLLMRRLLLRSGTTIGICRDSIDPGESRGDMPVGLRAMTLGLRRRLTLFDRERTMGFEETEELDDCLRWRCISVGSTLLIPASFANKARTTARLMEG